MSAPFFIHVAQRYRSPQNFNSQSKTYGKRPHSEFQWRPRTQYGPMNNFSTESNDEHWCETCDRGFPTADILEQHKQQHQKCSIDGCQFVAHPKVITRHIQMQHASGLYKKIAKLSNPEEIQKWREERKKKYPTRTNIEKKAAEYKEKVERGEKMGLKQSRNKIDKSAGQSAARDRFNKRNENHRTIKSNTNQQSTPINKGQPPPKKIPKLTPKIPGVVEKNKLKPFTGILSICMDDNDNTAEDICNLPISSNGLIEEDEYNEEQIQQPIAQPLQEQPVMCGALTSLMCNYGSSDEDNENDNKTTNVVVQHKSIQLQNNDRLDKKVKTSNNNTNNHIEIVRSNIKEETNNPISNNLANDLHQTSKSQDDSDNDSGPEEVKIIKMDNIETPCTSSTTSLETSKALPINSKKNFHPRKDHRHQNRYKHKVPSTLLQKLLYKEVRQERNIVLQCIRHIRKKNYFDKPNE